VHRPAKIDKRRIFFNLLEVFADREQTFNRDIRLRILLQPRSHLLIFSVLSMFRLFICFDIDLKELVYFYELRVDFVQWVHLQRFDSRVNLLANAHLFLWIHES